MLTRVFLRFLLDTVGPRLGYESTSLVLKSLEIELSNSSRSLDHEMILDLIKTLQFLLESELVGENLSDVTIKAIEILENKAIGPHSEDKEDALAPPQLELRLLINLHSLNLLLACLRRHSDFLNDTSLRISILSEVFRLDNTFPTFLINLSEGEIQLFKYISRELVEYQPEELSPIPKIPSPSLSGIADTLSNIRKRVQCARESDI
jgi:hypothetical protein